MFAGYRRKTEALATPPIEHRLHCDKLRAMATLNKARQRLRDYVDAVTEGWIGWTFPPVQRAMDDAQWVPDERSAYCGRCGDSVGVGEATELGCATCREGAELSGGIADGVVRLGPHVDALRDWIVKVKYQHWAEMGDCLGRFLAERIRKANVIDPRRTVVVPMPMPWQRRIYRGIDHTKVIAAALGRELRAPVVSVLAKANRPPQVTLPPSERRRTGSRGLSIRRRLGGWPLADLHVVLVDDVRTTGATLKGAVRLLSPLKPARIVCGVIAVSDSKARRDRAHQTKHGDSQQGQLPQEVPAGDSK